MAGVPGSDNLKTLVVAALQHGLSRLGQGETLEPSLIAETGTGERTLQRFTAPDLKTGVRAARKAARERGVERAVVCWNGTIASGGEQHHAVYALAQEQGQPRAHVFVQRHTSGDAVEPVGNPGYVGEQEPML